MNSNLHTFNAQQPDPNSPGGLIPIGEQMGEGWSDSPGVLGDDSDPDGDEVMAAPAEGPSHARKFSLHADGSFEYRPEVHFEGTDSFTYRAQDGELSSGEATVTIEVSPR